MFFRVLGPLEAEHRSERITIPGLRSRALLTALLLQPNTAVPATRLVDALWGDGPPDLGSAAVPRSGDAKLWVDVHRYPPSR
jgi:DNA-binding SARP family transcriptional activator